MARRRRGALHRAAFGALLLVPAGCYSFHLEGPSAPSAVTVPGVVSVSVSYIQPFNCLNVTSPCDNPVLFSASWMRPGANFRLVLDPATHIWRGTALDVPVNFPPRDDPYTIRVFDPFLQDGPSQGFTAEHVTIGGQTLVDLHNLGTPSEYGLIYVDASGVGHTPF